MKKKMLSLATVLCLGIGFVGGCNKDDNSFKKLTLDGQDIVLTVGKDSKYTADDLFNGMLSTEVGAQTAYEKILKMIVENSVDTDSNMKASWDLLKDAFEDEVTSKANSEGISKKAARKALLAEDGYSSMSEKKEAYFYEVKLAKLQDEYWKLKKDAYFEEYLKERLPYYVKHILVNTGYTEARGPYNSIIDDDDAKDLYDVYSLLAKGEKFSYVMNHKSEDKTDGTGYHMDLTTSFVPEFLHGVFVLDSLLENKTAEVEGLTTDVLSYYVNNLASTSEEKDYNFNIIYASDIETLGEKANVSEKNDISTCENDDEDKETCSGGLSDTKAYGSASALYTRTIIFNQTFNNPGISVIALDENLPDAHYVELTVDGKKQKFLADENDNLVFIACARGSGNYQVHFLTVDVSPFDENIKLFYSMDQKTTIEEMVKEKETALKADNSLSETAVNTQLKEYREKLESYKTYVDIMGGETQKGRNVIIDKLEATIKAYAQRGITYDLMMPTVSGKNPFPGEDQFLTYDMVEYYMDKGDVVISDSAIKALVETYIANQKSLIDFNVSNYISDSWGGYYTRVAIANSPEILNKKIPMECAYGVNRGAACKFNYDEENGFEINITYKEVGNSFEYMPDDYIASFKIGEGGIIVLPTAKTEQKDGMYREGYTFDGWYSTSTYETGTEVTQIDTTRSSTKNKVVVYAKWTKVGGEN